MLPRTDEPVIHVSISKQLLSLMAKQVVAAEFSISTAANGPGEEQNSGCTPRGWHQVRAKIGANVPINTVFQGRRPTGEIYGPDLAARYPNRDWILTRILWLSGLESGKNRLGHVDTMRRYIYIHGSPDTAEMGMPRSHGCIRMHNADIVDLFQLVSPGTRVWISEFW